MDLYEVLRRPVITEKNTIQTEMNKFTFVVAVAANKVQIKDAVERCFQVKVTDVNTYNQRGKLKRSLKARVRSNIKGARAGRKKAIVTIVESNDRIKEFFGVV